MSIFSRLRSVLNHSRAPISAGSYQNAKLYRVRFLRQPVSPSKVTVVILAHMAVGFIWVSTASALSAGKPIFIPLAMAQALPPTPYSALDPEAKSYQEFSKNREQVIKARAVFRELAIQALQKAFKDKLGKNVKSDASLLYFHFPPAPPPKYVQSGIEISYTADEDPSSNRRYLTFALSTREWDHSQILLSDHIMYPRWMLSAVSAMIRDLFNLKFSDIKEIASRDRSIDAASITTSFKNDLRKNRPKPPVPQGHIVIDGMVQIISDQMVVNVDLTGSFNPHNLNERTVQRMTVRFAGRLRRPTQDVLKKPIELPAIPYPKDNTPNTVSRTAAAKLNTYLQQTPPQTPVVTPTTTPAELKPPVTDNNPFRLHVLAPYCTMFKRSNGNLPIVRDLQPIEADQNLPLPVPTSAEPRFPDWLRYDPLLAEAQPELEAARLRYITQYARVEGKYREVLPLLAHDEAKRQDLHKLHHRVLLGFQVDFELAMMDRLSELRERKAMLQAGKNILMEDVDPELVATVGEKTKDPVGHDFAAFWWAGFKHTARAYLEVEGKDDPVTQVGRLRREMERRGEKWGLDTVNEVDSFRDTRQAVALSQRIRGEMLHRLGVVL